MPKKKKNQDSSLNEEGRSTSSSIVLVIIVFIIVLIWLGIFGILIRLDVGSVGSKVLRPLIKDIPVINLILPDVDDETLAYENDYPYTTLDQAITRIKELELINDSLSETSVSFDEQVAQLQAEIDRLKVFEENQVAFEERVLEFDENVVFSDEAPSIEEYRAYYEGINPENAELIYKQVIEQLEVSESIKEKAEIYRKMKPKDAAAILENMSADIDLVAQMLIFMRTTESSSILAEMDVNNASKITKKMFDLDEERLNSITE